MKKEPVSYKRNARNIFFHILTVCNLKCKHCYINKEQHGEKMLSKEEILKWLKILKSEERATNLIFLGGEPTLHPDLSEIVKEARKMGYNEITIDTNGYLFGDILDKVTPKDIDYFAFSLDGADSEINDQLRGKGSYGVCINGISRALEQGFNVSVCFTVNRINRDSLLKMPKLLKSLNARELYVQFLGESRNAKQNGLSQLGRDEWKILSEKLRDECREHNVRVVLPKIYLNKDEKFTCAGCVSDNYIIFPNGRVYKCPLGLEYPIHYAEINTKGICNRKNEITELDLFKLHIPEGCVLNKLVQSGNLTYEKTDIPKYKVACCMLKDTF